MKTLQSTAVIFFIAVLCYNTSAQQNIYVKIYEVPQSSFVRNFEIVETYDNGYLSGNIGCLLKTDSLGNKQNMWENQTPGTLILSIDKTHEGGYVGSGSKKLIKLDSASNISWVKEFNNAPSMLIYALRETPDYGFILGGYFQLGSADGRAILIKTDSTGNVQWAHAYNTTASSCTFLTLTPDSGYLLCGQSISLINPLGIVDICVMKIDALGTAQWAKHYAFPGVSYQANHITPTSDGNYVICGSSNSQLLLKIDSAGNTLWMKEYLPQVPSVAQWVEETSDKGLIMGGYPIFFGGLLMKTDSAGNFQWVNSISGPNLFGGCVKQTHDGGYVFATRASSANGHAIEIIKTDSMGQTGGCIDFTPTVTVTNLNDTVINVPVIDSILSITTTPVIITTTNVGIVYDICPTGFQNLQDDFQLSLYPNPATTHITLQYNLTQNATLQIHDITGRRVQQTTLTKTSTAATIDVRTLPASMYFYTVQSTNGQAKTGKFIKE